MDIHIISFNIPFPADYGGVIDVFYKLKALNEIGVNIHLHCFKYGRKESNELNKYCKSVTYYSRNMSVSKFFSKRPFIVQSRINKKLIDNLLKDKYPILIEGIHCTGILLENRLSTRKAIVRTHNIEHQYYWGLFKTENNFFKKLFFYFESKKLQKFEPLLGKASAIAAISKIDEEYFTCINDNTELLTPFHSFNTLTSSLGNGNYILIHGDLSVPENINSILWIIENIASNINFKFIIAGRNPSSKVVKAVKQLENIELIANPDFEDMDNLIANAHICLIHSFMPQGFKLKLLNSIFKGRFCICNGAVVENTGLEETCIIANNANEFIDKINITINQEFNEDNLNKRFNLLLPFSNTLKAEKLVKLINSLSK